MCSTEPKQAVVPSSSMGNISLSSNILSTVVAPVMGVALQDPDIRIEHSVSGVEKAITDEELAPLLK